MAYLRQPIILLAVTSALSIIKHTKDTKYHAYVIHQVNKNNQSILPSAILALGAVGNKDDMKILVEIAKRKDGKFLFHCTNSMLRIDYDAAMLMLDELKKYFGPYSRQARLIDSVSENFDAGAT